MATTFYTRSATFVQGSTTLPGKYFTSPEIFALELDHIFYRHWLCAGRVSQISHPGDYFLAEIGNENLIVTRDKQFDQITRRLRVRQKSRSHHLLIVGDAELSQVTRQGAQHRDFMPCQSGTQRQGVEGVVFDFARAKFDEGFFKKRLDDVEVHDASGPVAADELVNIELCATVAGNDLIRTAHVARLKAHVFDERQDVRKNKRAFRLEEFKTQQS